MLCCVFLEAVPSGAVLGGVTSVYYVDSFRQLMAATLDARRALLADLSSYGVRRPPSRGDPVGRLGRRLATDLDQGNPTV